MKIMIIGAESIILMWKLFQTFIQLLWQVLVRNKILHYLISCIF